MCTRNMDSVFFVNMIPSICQLAFKVNTKYCTFFKHLRKQFIVGNSIKVLVLSIEVILFENYFYNHYHSLNLLKNR
jgi:hypothetical protein